MRIQLCGYMKVQSSLKFLTTSLDSCIESPTFKQDASTLERNYSVLPEESLLKENENESEWNQIGEITMEVTKNCYMMLQPMGLMLSNVKSSIFVVTKDSVIILKQNYNSSMVC